MVEEEKSKTILAVDDDPNIIRALKHLLKKAAYQVITALDGETALKAVEKKKPDLIISDVMMPGMDGYQLCKILRSQSSTRLIPFIFLTAKDTIDDRIEGIKIGADAYLAKPFDIREILTLLQTVLQRHQIYIEEMMRDELTGLPNRKYLFQTLSEEYSRARRYKRKLSIAMIDIDHFKKVNDSYGHQKGDRILIGVGELIRAGIRQQDTVGRYGGEEFLAVLPETGTREAMAMMNRLRKKIAAIRWRIKDVEISETVTISTGIAELSSPKQKIEDVIGIADRALYQAKEEGRNRVVINKPDRETGISL